MRWENILKVRLKHNERAQKNLLAELTNEWQTASDLFYKLSRKSKYVPSEVQIGKFLKHHPDVIWEEQRKGRIYKLR